MLRKFFNHLAQLRANRLAATVSFCDGCGSVCTSQCQAEARLAQQRSSNNLNNFPRTY